jgi:hypothetical protein
VVLPRERHRIGGAAPSTPAAGQVSWSAAVVHQKMRPLQQIAAVATPDPHVNAVQMFRREMLKR